jgi:hypothetical protein
MPEVKAVTVILSNPSGRPGDYGQVTRGFYVLDPAGKKLRLTDSKGVPVRRSSGDPVVRELKDGDDPTQIAGLLTREFRRHIHGTSGVRGFSGPLRYPGGGWR